MRRVKFLGICSQEVVLLAMFLCWFSRRCPKYIVKSPGVWATQLEVDLNLLFLLAMLTVSASAILSRRGLYLKYNGLTLVGSNSVRCFFFLL